MFKLAPFVLPPLTTVRVSQSELVRIAFHAYANAHDICAFQHKYLRISGEIAADRMGLKST